MKISTIKEFIPTLATSFVILGILKAMIFYYAFEIRILDYIDFSESLLLFFDDIVIIVASIILSSFSLIYLIKNVGESPKIDKKYLRNTGGLFAIIFMGFCAFYTYLILHKFFHFNVGFSLLYSILLLVLFGSYILQFAFSAEEEIDKINDETDSTKKKLLKTKFLYQCGIAAFLYIVITTFFYRTYKDLDNVIFEEPEKKIICVLKDSTTLLTGEDTLYLGQTHNNIFFYFKSQKKSRVLKMEDVKTIESITLKSRQPKLFKL